MTSDHPTRVAELEVEWTRLEAQAAEQSATALKADNERLREALANIATWRTVNLQSEWESGLRGIITSMADCAQDALNNAALGENA